MLPTVSSKYSVETCCPQALPRAHSCLLLPVWLVFRGGSLWARFMLLKSSAQDGMAGPSSWWKPPEWVSSFGNRDGSDHNLRHLKVGELQNRKPGPLYWKVMLKASCHMGETVEMGVGYGRGRWELSVLSAQFFRKPKIALRNKAYY